MNGDTRNTESLSRTANVILVVIFLSVALFLGLRRVDTYLKLKAMDDCMQASSFEQTVEKDNAVVSYPVTDMYKKCLQDKGY